MWEKFFLFVSLLEGGGRHLFILAAEIRVRAAFISADLQIHERGGGPGGGRAVLRINFRWPNVLVSAVPSFFGQ